MLPFGLTIHCPAIRHSSHAYPVKNCSINDHQNSLLNYPNYFINIINITNTTNIFRASNQNPAQFSIPQSTAYLSARRNKILRACPMTKSLSTLYQQQPSAGGEEVGDRAAAARDEGVGAGALSAAMGEGCPVIPERLGPPRSIRAWHAARPVSPLLLLAGSRFVSLPRSVDTHTRFSLCLSYTLPRAACTPGAPRRAARRQFRPRERGGWLFFVDRAAASGTMFLEQEFSRSESLAWTEENLFFFFFLLNLIGFEEEIHLRQGIA